MGQSAPLHTSTLLFARFAAAPRDHWGAAR